MLIVEDTRNQVGKHKILNAELKKMGHEIIRSKLLVGDYVKLEKPIVCIDTKKDYLELANNICGKSHERFRNECLRAKNYGLRLVVLVEEEIPAEQWNSPCRANKKPITQVKGETLAKAMKTMTEKYGVEFRYCDKRNTAKVIVQLLEEDEE